MKQINFLVILVVGLALVWMKGGVVFAQETRKILFFYGTGCPHCAAVEKYFEDNNLSSKYPIERREIYFDRDNAVLFNILMDRLKVAPDKRGVPTVVIGDKVFVGDQPIIANFVAEANVLLDENTTIDPKNESIISPTSNPPPFKEPVEKKSGTSSLTIAAVVAGAVVDAINPCAFAVLIILMTTILTAGNAKKALAAGLAFSGSIFSSYFLMGLGLYKALSLGNNSGWFFRVVGWAAILMGLFNLKDFLWYGKGFLMEVPLSWRPRLKQLIGSVTSTRGAFGIGFLVSLFLLPCTSGPYIVILGMLALKTLDIKAVMYLGLYNLIFVSPMILISLAVYGGYNPAKAEEKRQKSLRLLHLIAGLVMIGMGVVIIGGWI